MRKIAHIINPVVVDDSSDLFVAQPVTFRTMSVARDFAQGRAEVRLLSAQYNEDRSVVPSDFELTRDLDRSVLDLGCFRERRKLPLLQDILDRLYEATDADYLIYTNADIALMPGFYLAVDRLIEAGYDAFAINRRTIPAVFTRVADIPLMWAEAGEPHRGHDCFVFRRDAYPRFRLDDLCIGMSFVGRLLIINLACQATHFAQFRNLHLTFHIGNERAWKREEFRDYFAHNKQAAIRALRELAMDNAALLHKSTVVPYLDRGRFVKEISAAIGRV
jgi:hypothetical protein